MSDLKFSGITVEFDGQAAYTYEAHSMEKALEIVRESMTLGKVTRVDFDYAGEEEV